MNEGINKYDSSALGVKSCGGACFSGKCRGVDFGESWEYWWGRYNAAVCIEIAS